LIRKVLTSFEKIGRMMSGVGVVVGKKKPKCWRKRV